MTGTIDLGERSPLNVINPRISNSKMTLSPELIHTTIHDTLEEEIELYNKGVNLNGGYKEVAKIWPGTLQVLPEFKDAVKRFSSLSNSDTLTTVIIFSHGENGSIQMGDSWLSYQSLLKELDSIAGKKAVFMYACHSGSFQNGLEVHPEREDYATITSCKTDEVSTTWNEQELDNILFEHFRQKGKYSDLQLKPISKSGDIQHPQLLGYVDVQLI